MTPLKLQAGVFFLRSINKIIVKMKRAIKKKKHAHMIRINCITSVASNHASGSTVSAYR